MSKKYSIYNTLLKVNDRFGLFYNAMSDKFIVLRSKAYEDLANNDISQLKQYNTALYNQLQKVGGIVNVELDEIQQVRNLIHDVDVDDTIYYLHVNPTVDCNFSCWYCYENHEKGSKMSNETCESVKKLIDNIISQHENLNVFELAFFGGEPLMYFRHVVQPLMQYLYNICKEKKIATRFQFTTNGYLLTSKMMDFFDGKDVGFQITLDGNREQHDKTRFPANGHGSFDTIVDNIKQLALRGHDVIVRINFTAENITSVEGVCSCFETLPDEKRKHIRFDFQRVWQDEGKAPDENTLEETVLRYVCRLREDGFNASYIRFHDKVRCSCYGDKKNYLLVNYDGNVFNCIARDFVKENRSGYLCNDGTVVYDNCSYERRSRAKFSKHVCHECRIAPICGGGCAQKAIENMTTDKCLYGYTDKDIDDLILNRFDYSFAVKDNSKRNIN